jgi:type I restriction enzyme M protein
MSEKRTETYLSLALQSGKFEPNCIYYSPTENGILKHIFSRASKTGDKHGIPDRLYFDNQTLVVFECKKDNLTHALEDLVCYKEKMIDYSNYNVFFVAVIHNVYEIYDLSLQKLTMTLDIKNFKDTTDLYTTQQMDKDIHRIHNYIRDYTKISNEDKSFFIACILISLNKNSFIEFITNYDTKKYIYDILKQNLLDFEIDISVFEFLRNDENNVHFYNIIMMVKSIYDKNPGKDLLNDFYKEFVKYSNTDGKSLGIVLTPDHIVKLMIEMLDIQPTDTVLDLCTGTGSFLLEASKYKPKQLIGCEYQTKLYSLLKCNFILRGLNYPLIKGDCFENEFKATKSVINPPYGMKDKKELDFIIKQLESVEDGGLVCAIIPRSKLNSNKPNDRLKRELRRLGKVLTIINCNPKLFYPSANISCCIVLIRRGDYPTQDKYLLLDYEDDGIDILRHSGLIKNASFETKYKQLIDNLTNSTAYFPLTVETDWCYMEEENDPTGNFTIDLTHFTLIELEKEHQRKRQALLANPTLVTYKYKEYKIGELFTLKTGKCIVRNTEEGIYPLITSSSLNNGITKYVNVFSFEDCITVANSGSVGCAFYQEGKFDCTSHVTVLTNPIKELNDKRILLFICRLLETYKTKYNFGLAWSMQRMKEDVIRLPINEDGELDFSTIVPYVC